MSEITAGTPVAKSCILIWLDGGPSHIDTFDPKPNAPVEVRGPFRPISTAIPGVQVSELFPRLASRLDRCTIVRSLTSPLGEHNLGAQYLLTGFRPTPAIEYPSWPSVLTKLQSEMIDGKLSNQLPESLSDPTYLVNNALRYSGGMPGSVTMPNSDIGGGRIRMNGFLPAQFAPFSVDSDPASEQFSVKNLQRPASLSQERLSRRQAYRQYLDGTEHADPLTQKAFQILQSEEARIAFDLKKESESTRSRFGEKAIGQCCLLARRLVEAGVRLVSVVSHGWDTHSDVVTRLRDGYTGAKEGVGLGPSLDQALSALLDDLQDRGLFDETLVVVMGEFGRTPKWNASGGRDHWPRAFSVLLAGGPIRRGAVYGSSDRHGESPHEHAVTPAHLTHTIYRAMGIDCALTLQTPDGRPIRIADETAGPILDLFG